MSSSLVTLFDRSADGGPELAGRPRGQPLAGVTAGAPAPRAQRDTRRGVNALTLVTPSVTRSDKSPTSNVPQTGARHITPNQIFGKRSEAW